MSYEQKVHKKREILEFVLFRQNPKYLEVCYKNEHYRDNDITIFAKYLSKSLVSDLVSMLDNGLQLADTNLTKNHEQINQILNEKLSQIYSKHSNGFYYGALACLVTSAIVIFLICSHISLFSLLAIPAMTLLGVAYGLYQANKIENELSTEVRKFCRK